MYFVTIHPPSNNMSSSEEANGDGTAGRHYTAWTLDIIPNNASRSQVSAGEFGSAADTVGSGIESGTGSAALGVESADDTVNGGMKDGVQILKEGWDDTKKGRETGVGTVEGGFSSAVDKFGDAMTERAKYIEVSKTY